MHIFQATSTIMALSLNIMAYGSRLPQLWTHHARKSVFSHPLAALPRKLRLQTGIK